MHQNRHRPLIAIAGMAAAFATSVAGFVAAVPMMIPHASVAAETDELLVNSGASVYAQSGCASCHESGIGPALEGVGQRLSTAQLRSRLMTESATMPSYAALAEAPAADAKGRSQLDALISYLEKQ